MYSESSILSSSDIPNTVLTSWIRIINYKWLLHFQTTMKEKIFPMTSLKHVKVDSYMAIKKSCFVKCRFSRCLNTYKYDCFHDKELITL